MPRSILFVHAIAFVFYLISQPTFAIDVTENSDGGPSAQRMANIIVDDASLISVVASSANTTINAAGAPSSDNNAYGSFVNGVTAAGTLLPAGYRAVFSVKVPE